ncbi:SDR family oxidoreductase [Kitasatospora viridis]|uniref:Short-subunit dehydrogenase n=1 Tax=Kitasatospora viridis TaxID=281105 RepID=A0A561UKI4_9ACTN|nr:SDR family oxidoreductase [Kitasatospora viridis]TWF99872.1 short-subunit dehydrogenase [Kitasatospora viridis]
MTTKTVLVTGTSSGIGLATAVALAEAGWHVIATMRDTGKAGALLAAAGERANLEVRALDVTDPASVTACLDGLDRLDAVVNNAGAGHVGTLELDSIEEVRGVMEVNFFGVLTVSKAALPLLRASGGRLLTVTSVGGVVGQPFNEAYCAAKFAVEGYLESLAPVAAQQGVTVSVIEPAAVASEFVANVGGIGPELQQDERYGKPFQSYLAHVQGAFAAAQPVREAAEVIVATLTAEQPPFRVQTSERAKAVAALKLADTDGSAVQAVTSAWIA